MNYTGFGQIGTPTAYSFGGGNFPRDFSVNAPFRGLSPNQTYQTWEMDESGKPRLSQAAKKFGVQVLPAGATSRQEMRYLLEEAKSSGRPYVEAPTMYKLNDKGQYVDPLTGKGMGTISINYSAGGWRNAKGKDMASGGGYSPRIQAMREARGQKPEGPESGGYKDSGGPQPAQNAKSPFSPEDIRSLMGFGGIPRFPYATY
jgi:hypothetical protein